ncbi:MAG: maltose alpha-D-glucosyltransferase [bacterium]
MDKENLRNEFLKDDPLWYKEAIIYELHVKAFYDSNGDGIGDFRGLIQKLDYLQQLGITALWLLPFYPSPLRDDGYDIADYCSIHPDYGTLKDFKEFLEKAHTRGIRVITELVMNHTSNEHEWFQKSRRAKSGSRWRQRYVWSATTQKYEDARIIFQDYETSNWTWDPVAQSYFWHRFYSHQPDLNFDNPVVQKEMLKIVDFWFEMGVDGLRLDAVPYLFEQDGTNCENLPQTHAYLKKLRNHVDKNHKNKMLLSEANQWPEDASAYFGDGDESHMAFHFPLMPRLFMAIQMGDSYPIIDILKSTPPVPDSCQWAIFLRNHDELTLEMVTDEEKDYMYRSFARDPKSKINVGIRRRLASLLDNNRRKIELMNILLFSLPGTPVLYYGDEIGMGDNYYLGDRNGVRTPMQWSLDRNAGFSKTNPQMLYLPTIMEPGYHYEAINVETQEKNLSSLLWWMKRVIAMRKRYRAFGRGSFELVSSNNHKVFSYLRCYEEETILVVVNLSRYSQMVTLDLIPYAGYIPEEIFSTNTFLRIGKRPYALTICPYSHYWLLLKKEKKGMPEVAEKSIPEIRAKDDWHTILKADQREKFEQEALVRYVKTCRWFGAKAKTMRKLTIIENAPLTYGSRTCHVLLLEITYIDGVPDTYLLPLSFAYEKDMPRLAEKFPQSIIAHCKVNEEEGILYDGFYEPEFQKALLDIIVTKKQIKGNAGTFYASSASQLKKMFNGQDANLISRALAMEQSNTSILYGNKFYLKFYRHVEEGVNPDLEIVKLLTEKDKFSHIAPYKGAIEYQPRNSKNLPNTIALLQECIENHGNAWEFTHDAIIRYFERILSKRKDLDNTTIFEFPLLFDITYSSMPPLLHELISIMYLDMISLLGKRTAELHYALGSLREERDFAPEPFSLLYQRSLYQSMQNLVHKTMQSLEKNLERIPRTIRNEGRDLLSAQQDIEAFMKKILRKKMSAVKIRIHGDYHLGQVLYTGKDFVIIDFEGEPARALSERRLKHTPLKDVAGMMRSFHYAVSSVLLTKKIFRQQDIPILKPWIEPWYFYVSGVFLSSYLQTIKKSDLLPADRDDVELLLHLFLLEKVIYEVDYELNNRPDWLIIPLEGVKHTLENIKMNNS